MKKKSAITNLKSLRASYKIALVFAVISVVANLYSFFFVLLPTYDLVGQSLKSDSNEFDQKLDKIIDESKATQYITYASIAAATLAGAYGVAQDVSSKSKK